MGLFGKRDDLKKLLARLEDEPAGPERLALLEQGIAEAARLKDDDAGFDLRENLLLSSVMIGRLDRCIPAVEWCLSRCDAEPNRFDIRRILFQYKWIVEELPRHSEFSRETIATGIDDLEARFLKAGWGLRGPTLLRMITSLTMADVPAAEEAHAGWIELPRDQGSDCPACEAGHEVRFRLAMDDDKGAIEAAAPLLDGTLKCEDEPALTLSRLPSAYFESDQGELGVETMKRAIDLTADGHQFCEARSRLMQTLLLTGNVLPAVRLLEISMPQALNSGNDLSILQTSIMAVPILDLCARRSMELPEFQALPPTVPPEAEAVRDWLSEKCDSLAAAFDERNGNSFYSDFWAAAREMAEHYPDDEE